MSLAWNYDFFLSISTVSHLYTRDAIISSMHIYNFYHPDDFIFFNGSVHDVQFSVSFWYRQNDSV